jgi:hypothetical protein
VPRIVTVALAAFVVALTLSSGTRNGPQVSPWHVAACHTSAHGPESPDGAAGRCDDQNGPDRMAATGVSLPGPTSPHTSGSSPSRVQLPPANRRHVPPDLALARAHDPAHLHAYSLLI